MISNGSDDSQARWAWLNISPARLLILLIDLAILIVIWHVGAEALNERFLPTPDVVLERLIEELRDGELVDHLITSSRRVILSLLIGVAVATPLAWLTAQIKLIDQILTPLIYFAFPAPKVVFIPLILYFFGISGDTSRVFLISLVISFQVFVITYDSIKNIQPETLDSMSSLGAGNWHMLRYVYIPVSIPAIITALKISTGTAIAVLYIAEGIAGRTGLGYYINNNFQNVRYENIYAGIIVISGLGLALFALFWLMEQYLTRWQK